MEITGCFGCLKDGHRIGECPEVQELIAQDIVVQDAETRRLRMKDGSFIKRAIGESLAQAARRISAVPRIMFVTVNPQEDEKESNMGSYQIERQGAWIEDVEESSDDSEVLIEESAEDPLDAHWYGVIESDFEEESLRPGEVYLSASQKRKYTTNQVHSADRTVPSTKTTRREVFDGVHIPRREKPRPFQSIENKNERKDPGKRNITDAPALTPRDALPEIRPVDARTPRRDVSAEMDIDEPEVKVKRAEKHAIGPNGTGRAKDLKAVPEIEEGVVGKSGGRQSDVQNTVNLPSIINRILDLTVPMTV
jgi:hypothetical protein